MRRLIERSFLISLAVWSLLPAGCRRQAKAPVEATEEEPPALASTVHVADPRTFAQLLKGFHGLEQNAWRWTAGKFSVVLRPPSLAAQKGATLRVQLTVPDPVIQESKAVTLTATVSNVALPPERYTQTGEYVFTREVPASALSGSTVTVDFSLDKSLPPGGTDRRELGIIVTTIGLEPK
jgi:hypothetical protein